jgi:hypothetical protein
VDSGGLELIAFKPSDPVPFHSIGEVKGAMFLAIFFSLGLSFCSIPFA